MAVEKLLTRGAVSKVPIAATVTLDAPPSTNALFLNVRGRGRVRTPEYERWLKAAGWAARAARLPFFPGRVAVEIRVGKPKRARDLDNYAKALLDFLTRMRIIDDDVNVWSLLLEKDEATVEAGTVRVRIKALGSA